jgi:hypothetical protein
MAKVYTGLNSMKISALKEFYRVHRLAIHLTLREERLDKFNRGCGLVLKPPAWVAAIEIFQQRHRLQSNLRPALPISAHDRLLQFEPLLAGFPSLGQESRNGWRESRKCAHRLIQDR